MTIPMMRDHPQLPLIPLDLALKLFKRTTIGPSAAAAATGITRITIHRWMSGGVKRPSEASLNSVSTLAYKVLRAIRHGHLPLPDAHHVSAKSLLGLLPDDKYPVPLSESTPQELLPKSWLDQFNLPREHHATESVL